jgi:hypothetical protein
MRRLSSLLFFGILFVPAINGQTQPEALQPRKSIEKSITAGQTHSYSLNLEKDQYVQLAVEQNGIDVVMRVFLPTGNLLHEFDSPTGKDGTDYAEVISESAGIYRIEIAPLADDNPAESGKYQLKVVDWRKATDDELQFVKNDGARKAKGLALVLEAAQGFDQFRLPETQVDMRLKAAQLLWPSDEKKALAQMAQAIETVKQILAQEVDDDDYSRYRPGTNLREQIVSTLAPHDPEAALKFLQSTRPATAVYDEQELQLESSLVEQIVNKDPKRAFELAENMLQRSSSQTLLQMLGKVAQKDRELARRLAHDIAKKVEGGQFSKDTQAAYLAAGLLQFAKTPLPASKNGDQTQSDRLLSEDEFRALSLKIITEFLADDNKEDKIYGTEYVVARSLAMAVQQMLPEIKTYAPERVDAVNKRMSELGLGGEQPGAAWQKYRTAAMNDPIDSALESVEQAPEPIRDYLYQQVVNRVVATGDVAKARQLVSERISNSSQKKQLLHSIQQQAISNAAQKGRFAEALQLLAKFPRDERITLIGQVVAQIGVGVKKAEALEYLEQAKILVGASVRAEDSEQMQSLMTIARAYARPDATRGFQMVEPLIDQYNEICAAAVTMNGFGGEYYVEGEMTTARDNTLTDFGNEISRTLATLAMADFDRAKRDANGITRYDARVRALLAIAAQVLDIKLEDEAMNPRRRYVD